VTYLIDTSVLLRLHDKQAVDRVRLQRTLQELAERGDIPVLAPQVIFESWTVLTREVVRNGFGYGPDDAAQMLREILSTYDCLADPPGITLCWLSLCEKHLVRGRQGHDCRLVAWMQLHGIRDLLTLNAGDFARYAQVEVVDLSL
jgi:predicted nucleic acid-binding protein